MRTYDKAKKKTVYTGDIQGDTYIRRVNNKHYMVKEGGYGIQKSLLPILVKENVRYIIIKAKQTTYRSTLATWLARGHTADYGHGEQIFLRTDYMEKGTK